MKSTLSLKSSSCSSWLGLILFFLINTPESKAQDSLTAELKCLDLSENMHKRLSTKDDEVLILVYPISDCSPPHVIQHTFDSSNMSLLFKIASQAAIVLIVELDENKNIERIEPPIRVYLSELIKAAEDNNLNQQSKYLGDNDIIGYIKLTKEHLSYNRTFKGRHKMDKFHYDLIISPKN